MIEPKHTTGGWIYEPADRGDESVGVGPTEAFVYAASGDEPPIVIATVHQPIRIVTPNPTDVYDDGRREVGDIDANGRLLAAAPDLLDTCLTLLLASDGRTPFGVAANQARLAVEKAGYKVVTRT